MFAAENVNENISNLSNELEELRKSFDSVQQRTFLRDKGTFKIHPPPESHHLYSSQAAFSKSPVTHSTTTLRHPSTILSPPISTSINSSTYMISSPLQDYSPPPTLPPPSFSLPSASVSAFVYSSPPPRTILSSASFLISPYSPLTSTSNRTKLNDSMREGSKLNISLSEHFTKQSQQLKNLSYKLREKEKLFSSGTNELSELPVSTPGESLSSPRDRGEKLADLLQSMKLKLIELSTDKEKRNEDFENEDFEIKNVVEMKSEVTKNNIEKINKEDTSVHCYDFDAINVIDRKSVV